MVEAVGMAWKRRRVMVKAAVLGMMGKGGRGDCGCGGRGSGVEGIAGVKAMVEVR